jgi:hypothetical protein
MRLTAEAPAPAATNRALPASIAHNSREHAMEGDKSTLGWRNLVPPAAGAGPDAGQSAGQGAQWAALPLATHLN